MRRHGMLIVFAVCLVASFGCHSSDSTTGGGSGTVDLAGQWTATIVETASTCDVVDPTPSTVLLKVTGPGPDYTYIDDKCHNSTIHQDGASLTFGVLTETQPLAVDCDIVSTTNISATVTDENHFSGTTTTACVDAPAGCSGIAELPGTTTASVVATRCTSCYTDTCPVPTGKSWMKSKLQAK